MENRLSWSIVKEHFSDQWIELADYRWDWEAPHPAWVVVRRHASERSQLLSLISDHSLAQHKAGQTQSPLVGSATSSEESDEQRQTALPAEPVILYVGATYTVPTHLSTSV